MRLRTSTRTIRRGGKKKRRAKEALIGISGCICWYCEREKAEEELTIDHIIPIAAGGNDAWTNLALACSSCNRKKGRRLSAEYLFRALKVEGANVPPAVAGELVAAVERLRRLTAEEAR